MIWLISCLSLLLVMILIIALFKKGKKKKLLKGAKRLQQYEIKYLPISTTKQRRPIHPHYIFAEKGANILSMNTTHQKPKCKRVIRLSHNPDPNDNRPTYAVKEIHTTSKLTAKKHRNMTKKGWYYHPEDIKLMEKWIRK